MTYLFLTYVGQIFALSGFWAGLSPRQDSASESEQDEPAQQLTSESLSVLPRELIEKFYKAAACGDEQAVRLLIERIPLSQKQIAAALTKLVDNMNLDIISDLSQKCISADCMIAKSQDCDRS